MDGVFQYAWALAVVGLLLFGLFWAVRLLASGRLLASTRSRLVTVVESTLLAPNTTVHVVKVAGRYYLVGGGSAGVTLIAEVPAEDVDPFIETQRKALSAQTERLGAFWNVLRKRR